MSMKPLELASQACSHDPRRMERKITMRGKWDRESGEVGCRMQEVIRRNVHARCKLMDAQFDIAITQRFWSILGVLTFVRRSLCFSLNGEYSLNRTSCLR